ANAKSASPLCRARISLAIHTDRVSISGSPRLLMEGTQRFRKPLFPKRRTRVRHISSTSSTFAQDGASRSCKLLWAQFSSSLANSLCFSSKKGQSKCAKSDSQLLISKDLNQACLCLN